MSTLTASEQKYTETHERLEALRRRSRIAREELIQTIMCDKKDVLASSDIKEIQKSLAHFLAIQDCLGKAFFLNATAEAKLLFETSAGPIPEDGFPEAWQD